MSNKRLTKFITGAVAAIIAFSTGVPVLAAQKSRYFDAVFNTMKNIINTDQTMDGTKKDKNGFFNSILNEMVKDGTLTQAEADKIIEYKKEKQKAMKAEKEKIKKMTEEERKNYFSAKKQEGMNFLTELVDKGIITQNKADALKARIQIKKQEMKTLRQNEIKNKLGELVKQGTINQAQADKVIEYLNQNLGKKCKPGENKINQIDKDKIKSMTEEERKEYFKKMRGDNPGFLKDLVDDGIITQDQANAIGKAIRPN